MKILALDLGSLTGYALEADDYPLACGTWKLASARALQVQKAARMDRRCDIRFTALFDNLDRICASVRPDLIVFEDVQFASTSMQAHLWASLRAAVWMMNVKYGIRIDCCPVTTLKKHATGSGAASKEAMASYLLKNPRFSACKGSVVDNITHQLLDDNAVDALHLLQWAKKLHKKT